MRVLAFSVLALGFGVTSVQLAACSNSADDCNATATCGNTAGTSQSGSAGKSGGAGSGAESGAPEGGTAAVGGSMSVGGSMGAAGAADGAGGEGGSGTQPCSGDVSDDAACWTTDEHGVFVSNEGGDDATGDGTQAAPFATIGKGIASAAGKNIYVCLGSSGDPYAERVTLTATSDGARIYGGFDCSDWSYSATRSAEVVSPDVIALRIQNLKKGAHLENLRFTAADGSGVDASSYGAFVTNSMNVSLKRVELTAGQGLKGANGEPGSKGANGSASGAAPIGADAICTAPPTSLNGGTWANESTCGSLGGNGGDAQKSNGGSGLSGTPTDNVSPPNVDNGGSGATAALAGEDGGEGMPGDAGSLGLAAAQGGLFTASGFASADGNAGGTGHAGQGGGGGGASKGNASCVGASGGAGGMGGCGGTSGKGGAGGGASVALFSWKSGLVLEACSLTAVAGGAGGDGGKGGARGAGADGGSGGAEDADNGIEKGRHGGTGGHGGNGGSGSGGTGGPSYALVYSGTQPSYDLADSTLTPGDGGAKGVGGQVLTEKAPDGSQGDSQVELEVQ